MDIRILLIASEGEALDAYQEALDRLGVGYDTVYTLAALQPTLMETAYNGLLLDVDTMSRADRSEKAIAKDLLDFFPVIRLKWEARTGSIRTLYYGEVGGGSEGLDQFITEHCRNFDSRAIRRSVRKAIHLNITASIDPDTPAESWRRTTTMDLSEDGCFLYLAGDWREHAQVWLQSPDLDDETPIRADVRWSVPWGVPLKIPGLGLEFSGLSDRQRTRIRDLLYPYVHE